MNMAKITSALVSPMPQTHTLSLPSGRILSYGIYGQTAASPPPSLTIFYFHGYPASHAEASLFSTAASTRHIRIIAPDRPGMGLSTHDPARTMTDWPADVLALADSSAINARRFAILGMSGGGPYVLACCRQGAIPRDRLLAAGVIAGMYPASLGLSGMPLESQILLWIAPWSPGLVEWIIQWGPGEAAKAQDGGKRLEELLSKVMKGRPKSDVKVWKDNEGGYRTTLIESVRDAVTGQTGCKGAALEAKLFASPWGFELGEVQMGKGKLVMWHGALDDNVPVAMAVKAHAMISGAELRVERDEGYASLVVHKVEEVLDVLLERASQAGSPT